MFEKWDIIYAQRFPESVKCSKCSRYFNVSNYPCPFCRQKINISNIIAKIRPIIIWIDQSRWFQNISFAIPLNSSQLFENNYNHIIHLGDYIFSHSDRKYQRPMRAIIHQATRVDGNTLSRNLHIGKITNTKVQKQIEDKLFNWIFSSNP